MTQMKTMEVIESIVDSLLPVVATLILPEMNLYKKWRMEAA